MSNTAGVAFDIDWNNAAAVEFLRAPGLNKQPQIQAVFKIWPQSYTATKIRSSTI